MSLILDALRKSERARQQSLTGQISNTASVPARTHFPVPWVTVIGLILVLNAVVLASLLWRNSEPGHNQSHATTANPIPVVQASKPRIRPLAEEAAAADTVNQTAQSDAVSHMPAAVAVTPTQTAPVQPSKAAGSVPLLDSLPTAFQQSLPALHMDVHGYAANPADRFVVINMQRYVAGDTLKEGPQVIAVTPQGVILEYHGTRFLLPRS